MKRWILVLGCYGLLVGTAEAGERWPANVCKDIQALRTILESDQPTPADRANQRFGVLLLQEVHCGRRCEGGASRGQGRVPVPVPTSTSGNPTGSSALVGRDMWPSGRDARRGGWDGLVALLHGDVGTPYPYEPAHEV